VVCNAVFQKSISHSVPEIFATKSRPFWAFPLIKRALKCWDMVFKITSISHHLAKFRGDWPRDLGDYALEKNKNPRQNLELTLVLFSCSFCKLLFLFVFVLSTICGE